ncbi:flavin reductase [Bradyrhizobium retamae]|uniref:flavin reductase n=1 Tax=Bradyrhizobium retamae TaxID=1300035 RepID=UPI0024BFFCD5|nr:flavin reductase [Bradyrhizobium retamae]
MEPPCLLADINASSETHDAILANGTFGVSLLGGNQQDLRTAFRRPAWRKRCPPFRYSAMGSGRP